MQNDMNYEHNINTKCFPLFTRVTDLQAQNDRAPFAGSYNGLSGIYLHAPM